MNHSLRLAKRIYYDKQFDYFKSNIKRSWKLINEVINKNKGSRKLPAIFNLNDTDISDPVEIANHFCDYFNNIGYNLAKKIPDANISHRTHLSGTYSSSISLNLTTQLEVSDIINSLRSGTAAGYDNIPISALKDSVDLISGPLAHIINLSISSGYFPDNMKIARVIPLFKSSDRRIFQNYRPISILPIFSKILERVVYKQVMEYITYRILFFTTNMALGKIIQLLLL